LIRKLIKSYPENQFFWLMGADSIIDFHLWEEWQEIVNLTGLVIGDRGSYYGHAVNSVAYKYAKSLNKCQFLKIDKVDISSTEIRSC